MAAELGISHVFQWPISIRNIYLIVIKLENDLDVGHINTTVKFHEDISPFRVKTRSFDFAIFLMAAELIGIDMFFNGTFLQEIFICSYPNLKMTLT